MENNLENIKIINYILSRLSKKDIENLKKLLRELSQDYTEE